MTSALQPVSGGFDSASRGIQPDSFPRSVCQGLATRPHPSPGQGGLERAAAAAVLLTVQRVERRPHEAARALLPLAGRKRGAVRYENAPDLLGVTHHHEPLRAGPQAKDRLPCAPPLHVGPRRSEERASADRAAQRPSSGWRMASRVLSPMSVPAIARGYLGGAHREGAEVSGLDHANAETSASGEEKR